ncbi:MAG: agmatine deiminase family protein [Verrucomicrobiota bacterium]
MPHSELQSAQSVDLSLYRMPAEWEPHEATWLAWPLNQETWPEPYLAPTQDTFAFLIAHLTPYEKVHLLIPEHEIENLTQKLVTHSIYDAANLHLHHWPYDDSWMRDAGPIFVKNASAEASTLVAHNFIFNSWGEKYSPWKDDNEIPLKAGQYLKTPTLNHSLVLEGGSIEVNGEGDLITTRQCLLSPNRNPHLNQTNIESYLCKNLGCDRIHWLGQGIEGDDTDGHIDDIARFVSPCKIVAAVEHNKSDPNFEPLKNNLKQLAKLKLANHQSLEVLEIPMPQKRLENPFGRSPASYANFYIANNIVFVPTYSDPNDERALTILQDAFPERKVMGRDCRSLVVGLGSIHCITQQQPL